MPTKFEREQAPSGIAGDLHRKS